MRLASRIGRLERTTTTGACCGACGFPRDPRAPLPAFRLVCPPPEVMRPGDPPPPLELPTDFCAGCGRKLVFRCPPPRVLEPVP